MKGNIGRNEKDRSIIKAGYKIIWTRGSRVSRPTGPSRGPANANWSRTDMEQANTLGQRRDAGTEL